MLPKQYLHINREATFKQMTCSRASLKDVVHQCVLVYTSAMQASFQDSRVRHSYSMKEFRNLVCQFLITKLISYSQLFTVVWLGIHN